MQTRSHTIGSKSLLFACAENVKQHILVVMAAGFHLFPFRTEKLSPLAPMVLRYYVGE